jgi:hypothetical protein
LANFLTVNLTFSLVFVNLILKVSGYIDSKIFVDNNVGNDQPGGREDSYALSLWERVGTRV